MKLASRRAWWHGAFAGGALALAMLCSGCMKDAAQLHVAALSRWHTDHADAVRLVKAEASVTDAHNRLRQSLKVTKLDLESRLRDSALATLAACEMKTENTQDVRRKKERIRCLEEAFARTEADRINRVGDRAEAFQVVHRLREAQEEYWEAVSRSRKTCAKEGHDHLRERLHNMNVMFHHIVDETTAKLSGMLRWRAWICARAVRTALHDLAGHIDALEKCRSWRPSDCEAPDMAGSRRHGQSQVDRCLAAVGHVQRALDEQIDAGRRRLERCVRDSAIARKDGKKPASCNIEQSGDD